MGSDIVLYERKGYPKPVDFLKVGRAHRHCVRSWVHHWPGVYPDCWCDGEGW